MLEFFAAVFLMLLAAKVLGELVHRIKLPTLVGELMAGIVIGPSILNLVQPDANLSLAVSISLFFVMLLTGVGLETGQLLAASRKAVYISLIAFVTPFAAGVAVSSLLGLGAVPSLVVGLTLAITAVPVNAIILMELGLLESELGVTVIAAGVLNDIVSLLILGIILQFPPGGGVSIGAQELMVSVLKVGAFVAIVLAADRLMRVFPRARVSMVRVVYKTLKTREGLFGGVLVFAIGVSLLAQQFGLDFVIGTFAAGLLVNEALGKGGMDGSGKALSGVTFGFFGPILFAFIGVEFDAQALGSAVTTFALLLAVAIACKLAGGYVGARLAGFSPAESRTIGFLVNSRGMVELVIATIAYQSNLIDSSLFSIVVGVGIVATVLSPITARRSLRGLDRMTYDREVSPAIPA